jgi:hypothetical protein
MIDKKALRKITLNARDRQQEEEEKQQAGMEAADKQKHLAEDQRALEIIRSIPEIARAEAEKGNGYAPIMTLSETGDYDGSKCGYDSHLNTLTVGPEALIGAAKTVFEYCQKAGLQPSVERVFSGYRSHYWSIEICWLDENQEEQGDHRKPWYKKLFEKS